MAFIPLPIHVEFGGVGISDIFKDLLPFIGDDRRPVFDYLLAEHDIVAPSPSLLSQGALRAAGIIPSSIRQPRGCCAAEGQGRVVGHHQMGKRDCR